MNQQILAADRVAVEIIRGAADEGADEERHVQIRLALFVAVLQMHRQRGADLVLASNGRDGVDDFLVAAQVAVDRRVAQIHLEVGAEGRRHGDGGVARVRHDRHGRDLDASVRHQLTRR